MTTTTIRPSTGDSILSNIQEVCRDLTAVLIEEHAGDKVEGKRASIVARGTALTNELRSWIAIGGQKPDWEAYPDATGWCYGHGVGPGTD